MNTADCQTDPDAMDAIDLEVFSLAAAHVFDRHGHCGIWPLNDRNIAGQIHARQ